MILHYNAMEYPNMSNYKKRDIKLKIFKPRAFKDYRTAVERKGGCVTVIRNTTLKECSNNEQDEFLVAGYLNFRLKEEKLGSAIGYIPVGQNRFVRIERKMWLLVAILIFIICGVICLLLWKNAPSAVEPVTTLEMENGDVWDGQQYRNNN